MELDGDEETTRSKKQRWDAFLENLARYDYLYLKAVRMIDNAENVIDSRISDLDEIIRTHKSPDSEKLFKVFSTENDPVARARAEKEKLKGQKETLNTYRDDLASEAQMPDESTLNNITKNVQKTVSNMPNSKWTDYKAPPAPTYEEDDMRDYGPDENTAPERDVA